MSDTAPGPRVLVTGFEPFGGSSLNPSQVVAESIAQHLDKELSLHTALLPVNTVAIADAIESLWRTCRPDIVLHFGESARAEHPTLERVAVNLLDFDSPDNVGQMVTDTPIDKAGPAARFATLPVRAMKDRLEADGIPTRLSLSAGAYLCNQALYLSLGHAERQGGKVGFVHVPSLPEQAERGERSGPTLARQSLLDASSALVYAAVALD